MSNIVAIENLRAERAGLAKNMQDLNAKAIEEKRTFTSEEDTEYDRIEADFDARTKQIKRLEKLEGFNADGSKRSPVDEEKEARDAGKPESRKGGDPFAYRATDEYRDALVEYFRAGDDMDAETRAALNVGTAAQGGYTVAAEWERTLIEALQEFGVVRELATVITTGDSGQLHIPGVTDPRAQSAVITAEAAAYTESEDTFTEKLLDAYKVGLTVKVSDELLHDSIFDISGFVQRRGATAISLKENTLYMAGTGTGQPNGLVNATVGKTTAVNNAITAAELVDAFHSLRRPYRKQASWIFNDSTVKVIRKIVDTTGQFIWQSGLQAGQPDVLLGRPVFTDPDVPAIATTAVVGIFGDISAYWIRDVAPMTVKVLTELYAANGQVGYRLDRRSDGEIIDDVAIRTLKMAV